MKIGYYKNIRMQYEDCKLFKTKIFFKNDRYIELSSIEREHVFNNAEKRWAELKNMCFRQKISAINARCDYCSLTRQNNRQDIGRTIFFKVWGFGGKRFACEYCLRGELMLKNDTSYICRKNWHSVRGGMVVAFDMRLSFYKASLKEKRSGGTSNELK